MLDPICDAEHLTDLDWASLMCLDPKRVPNKKLLNKKWLTENTYNKLLEAVDTLLNEPDDAPELVKSTLVN